MKQIITKDHDLEEQVQLFTNRVKAFWNWEQHPKLELEASPPKSTRSLQQNGLYWRWMEVLSTYFTRNGRAISKDEMAALMCHRFLGYVDMVVGNTQIRALRTTTWPRKLSVPDMSDYMTQIDVWAQEHGCTLPTPADEAYEIELKRRAARGES